MKKYQCYYNETHNYNGHSYIGKRVNTEVFETEAEAEKYCRCNVGIKEYPDGSYEEMDMNYDEVEDLDMQDRAISYTEYAVEINNEKGFVRQIDVFDTYEEAVEFQENYNEPLNNGEYLNIIFIDYDKNGDEICFGSVV